MLYSFVYPLIGTEPDLFSPGVSSRTLFKYFLDYTRLAVIVEVKYIKHKRPCFITFTFSNTENRVGNLMCDEYFDKLQVCDETSTSCV